VVRLEQAERVVELAQMVAGGGATGPAAGAVASAQELLDKAAGWRTAEGGSAQVGARPHG